ncbi:DUF1800 family protein [Massilia sp. IC2-476]|uniref:DUF1800 domain-containing protein n=1 Tax=Massilia sp. IC2-476 TaxID=2887199 RepID=UPI001D11766C|nr:DUF1800 domain-containing protein [Massilia sp. IC2-476]MCC2972267.1 DUF1800 domain-containing protein [Massilia sp. IC2-476]
MLPESIALNRFGLGARPGEQPPADPRRWLLSQFDAYDPLPAPWRPIPRSSRVAAEWVAQQREIRRTPEDGRSAVREAWRKREQEGYRSAIGARVASALQTPTPFAERLVHFWSNHFAVSVDKNPVTGLAGSFEADAIRLHILGRFEDLLLAAVRHPAMLVFLDQARSTGPDSPAGVRARQRQRNNVGLNENLAREILELHTLGVRSGYTQQDVTELARALTGWTLPDDGDKAPVADDVAPFRFAPYQHEPGERRVLGRSYAAGGEEQARAILRDLAAASSTAEHIALKLARHFVADEPPASLVLRLAAAFRKTGGDLPSVYRELVLAQEAWAPGPGKFKSPWDWAVSSLRALERREMPPQQAANLMNQLGQPVWRPGSPAGWGDGAGAWAAPDALLRRVEVAQRFGAQAGATIDARRLAPSVLPGLAEGTRQAIARSDSPATALALLLASPDFLRR